MLGIDELNDIKKRTGAKSVILEVSDLADDFHCKITVAFDLISISSCFDEPENGASFANWIVKDVDRMKARYRETIDGPLPEWLRESEEQNS